MSGARILRYGVPPPFEFEAPSSWLGRLALAQGCSLEEIQVFLDIHADVDVDQMMYGKALAELRRRCSLPQTAFAIAGSVMAGLEKTGLGPWSLATTTRGTPAFRYCPACLRRRSTPHLDIHWRFIDWRYCPLHNCLMESVCWQCRTPVCYPQDMALSKAGRAGNASQRRCLNCTADLAAAKPCLVNPATSSALTELEACWLLNGRALLASLCSGTARYRAEGVGTAALRRRVYQEWLPLPQQWLRVERRLRSDRSLDNLVRESVRLRPREELKTPWGSVISLERW
ncbi:MAG: TniQ family protein [Pelomonas sp.]|nr:TniQ family protein [Roseateles sp.]